MDGTLCMDDVLIGLAIIGVALSISKLFYFRGQTLLSYTKNELSSKSVVSDMS
jgi:hypothetical protein